MAAGIGDPGVINRKRMKSDAADHMVKVLSTCASSW